MSKSSLFIFCLLSVIILPLKTAAKTSQNELKGKAVLVFCGYGDGYVHDNIKATAEMFLDLAQKYSFTADTTSDADVFNIDSLQKYDVIVYANASYVDLNPNQRKAFQNFIRSGGAFMGVHAATCSGNKWDWFTSMIGGNFEKHPPLHKFMVKVVDNNHPSVKILPKEFEVNDELYMFNHWNDSVKVLAVSESEEAEGEYPSIWCNEFEGGKVWYTALGHLKEDYSSPFYRRHIVEGLRWLVN